MFQNVYKKERSKKTEEALHIKQKKPTLNNGLKKASKELKLF